MYSIKAITSLTGIGAETLRAWERRYQTVVPRRDDGGRRYYSQQDLDRLMLLANLTKQGHAISKLSTLQFDGLQELLNSGYQSESDAQHYVKQIIDALDEYRIDKCENLLKRALMVYEPLGYLKEILSPALHQVGDYWAQGRFNIAQEHIFTECVKRILLGMVNTLHSFSSNRPNILFATPSGEPHEFGILMCCLLAAQQHYNCFYLGPKVPASDLLTVLGKLQIDTLVLGLTQRPLANETILELDKIKQATLKQALTVWIGGSAAELWFNDQRTLNKNWQLIVDVDDFYFKVQQQLVLGKNAK